MLEVVVLEVVLYAIEVMLEVVFYAGSTVLCRKY